MDIQAHIINKLLLSPILRYSKIRPRDCENDLFNYHLQFLVKKGLVERSVKGYSLSDEGIFVAMNDMKISGKVGVSNSHKMNCLDLVVKQSKSGEMMILNHKRMRFPYMNQWGITGGSINNGETVLEAAKRTLKLKFGLDGEFIRIVQLSRVFFMYNDRLFQEITFWVCLCTAFRGELITKYEGGKNEWMPLSKVKKLEQSTKMGISGLVGLYETIEKTGKVPSRTRNTPEEVVRLDTLR